MQKENASSSNSNSLTINMTEKSETEQANAIDAQTRVAARALGLSDSPNAGMTTPE